MKKLKDVHSYKIFIGISNTYKILSVIAMILIFAINVNAQAPIIDYSFSGNPYDSQGNFNGDTLGHAPMLVPDRFGHDNSAYNFVNSSYIQAATGYQQFPFDFVRNVSFSAWVRVNSLQNDTNIIAMAINSESVDNYVEFSVAISGISNELVVEHDDNQRNKIVTSTDYVIDLHTLYHIVITRDFLQKSYSLYVDGTFISSREYQEDVKDVMYPDNQIFTVSSPISTHAIDATIDDVKFFTHKINGSTVDSLYNIGGLFLQHQPTDKTICLGEQLSLELEVPGSGLSYQWYKNEEEIVGETNYRYVVSHSTGNDNGTYFCKIENDEYTIYSDTVLVTVNELTIDLFVDDNNICEGESVLATASGLSDYNYEFFIEGISYGNTGADTFLTSNILNGQYIRVVGSENGCTDMDSVQITVNPLPEVYFTGLSSEYCENDDIVLLEGSQAEGLFTGAGVTVNVFDPSNGTIGIDSIIYFYTDTNDCFSADTQIVTVNFKPELSVGDFSPSSCSQSNGSASIIAEGDDNFTYQWDDGQNISQDGFNLSAGIHSVTVTNTYNCSNTISVAISDTLGPEVEVLSFYDAACPSSCDGTATISVTGGTGEYEYMWTSGEITQNANNLCKGENTIVVTDENFCVGTAVVDINSISEDNPTIYGTVYASGVPLSGDFASLYIYSTAENIHGGFHQETSTWDIGNDGTFVITDFPPGNYILKVKVHGSANAHFMNSYYIDNQNETSSRWIDASTVVLTCNDILELDINMVEKHNNGFGNGRISGHIYYPNENNKSIGSRAKGIYIENTKSILEMGEPVPGAEVFLELEPDEQPIANTKSDTTGGLDGYYGFENVANGSYSIYVEIPGFELRATYKIDVTDDDTLFIDRIFVVDTISDDSNIDTLDGIDDLENNNLSMQIFPNPFKNEFQIKINENLDIYNSEISIYNILGNKINAHIVLANNRLTIDAKSFKSGIYFVELKQNNIFISRQKIIKN